MILDEKRIEEVIRVGGKYHWSSNVRSVYSFAFLNRSRVEGKQLRLVRHNHSISLADDQGDEICNLKDVNLAVYPCFRGVFPDIDGNYGCSMGLFMHLLVYKLEGFKTLSNDGFRGVRNGTWMTREQLVEHILACKEALHSDFIFDVFTPNDNFRIGGDVFQAYSVALYFPPSMGPLEIKYILCWIRYAYEFPDIIALLDAYRLQRDLYPEESILNLFLLTARLHRSLGDVSPALVLPGDQIISSRGLFMTNEDLVNVLQNHQRDYLSNIYLHDDLNLVHVPRDNFNGYYGARYYWLSKEGLESRYEFYQVLYDYQKKKIRLGAAQEKLNQILTNVIGKGKPDPVRVKKDEHLRKFYKGIKIFAYKSSCITVLVCMSLLPILSFCDGIIPIVVCISFMLIWLIAMMILLGVGKLVLRKNKVKED